MNPEQSFWSGSGGNKYVARVTKFANYKYTDGYRIDVIKDFLSDIPKDSSVLEIGCSSGNFIQILKEVGFNDITGVEINKEAIARAIKRFPEFNFINKSIEDLDTNITYDLVITCGVLIHIKDNLQNIIEKIQKLSNKYIFGNEYYSKDYERIKYPAYCATGDYPSMFSIKPSKVEIHKLEEVRNVMDHIFYLLEK